MAVDNKQIATDVLELVGGAENVSVATNCMTRLRLTLKDNSKADVEKIKKVKGVLGCQFAGSQLQVIIGQNVPKVLAEFVAISGVKQGDVVDENLDAPKEKFELKNLPNIILDYLSGSMTQLIPLLMAGGLFRTIAAVLGPTMLGMFIGGAIGAVFSGLMGVTYYLAGGASNFLVFTNYLQGGQMNTVWAIVGMAISFVIAAAVVFATGFSKEELAEMEA